MVTYMGNHPRNIQSAANKIFIAIMIKLGIWRYNRDPVISKEITTKITIKPG